MPKPTKIDDILMQASIEFDNTFREMKEEMGDASYNLIKGYVKMVATTYYMTGRFDATQIVNKEPESNLEKLL